MTEQWEEYRGYTFRLEKVSGEWRTYLRYPSGEPIRWTGLFVSRCEYNWNFDSITMNRVIKKVKRWIDHEIDTKETIERWP